ncbi:RNA cytidine acetyltransferase isoform X1 [Drosophila grimshawi]|uniref:RNA cytidine acetyltransferase n=1 Tax=Drosophila grimshawi TaxID=7222 RepID=B4JJ54_DROGR|nr:RNA cytidine acetyltransferase isoform X1 [Drosophila grimshawi]EDV99606.1 GH12329 [Drosophila grimshawi]
MVKKKIDNRIRVMIENGVKLGHRTMFIITGDKARDQVPILYDILIKSTVKARPNVLWCYKNKDDAISNHGKKRAKKIAHGKVDMNEVDLFDAFRVATTIHGRYYSETHAILGRTYGVCVLQDFEALTPNLLARTIETVEGGGLIILLLKTMQSLKQLFTMSMDVHMRFRTEAHQTVTCRFNERLILSLANCKRCLVVNDDLTVLPLSSKTINVDPVNPANIDRSENESSLKELKESLLNVQPAGALVNLCKTYDQGNAVAQFIEALVDKQLKPPISLTAARGRGKSAALGLSIAAAVAFGYVNIYVTSPHPENLITLFEFVLKGFDGLEYQEHADYTIIRSTNPDYKKAIIRINITRNSRQTIQYIAPSDTHLLNAADLLLIDEAAAIPLPLVKKMIGPYLIFMASTINGYEGTGRSLSLKLISQLQKENNARPPLKLDESIRYQSNDDIERWLINLLCLDASTVPNISSGCPTPDVCDLYYIDRDALFSYHKAAESFLHRMVYIYVSSHYKNTPNDLQMMSDAPAHHLFCLLGPVQRMDQLPEILVVIQVALEGQISAQSISDSLGRGKKAAGDLIPWNIAEQYGDRDFPKLSGVRIVRIATHPNYQRMGYGKRAIHLLKDYYAHRHANLGDAPLPNNQAGIEEVEEEEIGLLKEQIRPRSRIPVLLQRLHERQPEPVDYIGTSYGLTVDLLKFWKSAGFVPVYLSQKANELTAEHSCIMLHTLATPRSIRATPWLSLYYNDFRRRVLKLMGTTFREFETKLCLALLKNNAVKGGDADDASTVLSKRTLDIHFLPHDLQRLESYARQQSEFRLILDLLTDIAQLYFQGRILGLKLDNVQKAVLLALGVQGKTVDVLGSELNMPGNQLLAKFYDALKKCNQCFRTVIEQHIQDGMPQMEQLPRGDQLQPLNMSLHNELEQTAQKLKKNQRKELKRLKAEMLDEYQIKGSDEDWNQALQTNGGDKGSGLLSVKSGIKRLDAPVEQDRDAGAPQTKKKKNSKMKRGMAKSLI